MIMPPVTATSAVSLSGDCQQQQQAKQSMQQSSSSSSDGHHSSSNHSSSSVASSSAIVVGHHHSMMQPGTPNSTAGGASSPLVDCAGCGATILDHFYLSTVDRHWHVSCLKCSQCKVDLQGEPSCFSRDGLIFCKVDYYRLFSMRRCSRCGEGIYASELVMRVRDQNVYHIQCFTCAWCNVALAQGDLFGIRDNLVYCRTHYEMLCSSSGSAAGGTAGGAGSGNGGGGGSCAREGADNSSPKGASSSLLSLGTGPAAAVADAAGAALLHHRHHLQHSNGPSSPPLLGPPSHHNPHHLHHPHQLSPHPHLPHHHPHHHHHHPSLIHPSLHQLDLPPDGCSSLAATPYATSITSSLYSPLSIHDGGGGGGGGGRGGGGTGPPSSSAPGSANNGQSPTTPQSIRKGRPRKRKNMGTNDAQQANDSMTLLNSSGGGNNSSCTHDSLSPTGARSSHSPGGSLDGGGPLSGLAASIENSCLSGSSGGLGGLSHSSQRTKRMRTSFKHHQLRTMKTYFSVNQNPDAKDLKQLAQKTGLSKRVLQVWFQNARAKWRRNNLKMMPDGPELSLNGQTLLSLGHPSTPSTVIGSPSGSTRPFSSPSPSALSPSTMHDGSCGGGGGSASQHSQQQMGNNTASTPNPSSLHSQPTSSAPSSSSLLDHSAVLGFGGHHQRVGVHPHLSDHSGGGGLLPLSFQELY